MAVSGLSKIGCTHSHLWYPLCSHLPLATRVTNVVLLALGAFIMSLVYGVISSKPSAPVKPNPTPEDTASLSSDPVGRSPHMDWPHMTPIHQSVQPPVPTNPVIQVGSKIRSAEQIPKLPEIVGISLDIIQRRARPAAETWQGCIANKDSLLDVIRKNWQQAQEAKITHAEIADHLNYLVKTAKQTPGKPISYDVETKTSNPEADLEVMPRFTVTVIVKKDNFDTDIFRPKDANQNVGASNEEALIVNTAVQGKFIRWTPVRERYIREFGFYSRGMEFDTVFEVLYGRFKV